jgi:hypothetical protein
VVTGVKASHQVGRVAADSGGTHTDEYVAEDHH